MSFCKTDKFSDILIPNIIEGDVFLRPADKSAYRARSRAGPGDPRLPRAVWRGSTGGFGGLAKGRLALLNLGQVAMGHPAETAWPGARRGKRCSWQYSLPLCPHSRMTQHHAHAARLHVQGTSLVGVSSVESFVDAHGLACRE